MTQLLTALCLSVVILQGCSLLFVAKGKTGFVAVKSQEAPKAKSLTKQMDRAYVIHHKVEEGETLAFLGKAFFGSEKKGAAKIAQVNYLRVHSKLKPGKILKIISPDNFPTASELRDRLKKLTQVTPVAQKKNGETDGPVFSTLDESQVKIEKIERPKINKAFAPGEKLVYEVRALSLIAGEATLEVDSPVMVEKRPCYPLVAKAKAAFPFSTIYPVKDVQTSYFDAVDFLTWKFENNVSEGNYKAQNAEK
ncbi:MAG TPA: DUF3108 domain-containing protein, partial [bacterium]|nr:DUF3108 domain-containing protein [bacterium]